MKKSAIFLLVFVLFITSTGSVTLAAEELSYEERIEKRMDLYKSMEVVTNIPWYYLAAVDTYERGLRKALRDRPKEPGLIGIYYSKDTWCGAINPNQEDTDPITIGLFGGIGLDGNGDGIASLEDDEDVLYTMARYLESYGFDKENIRIGLWEHYHREQTVNIIMGHAKVYEKFETLNVDNNVFPVPLNYNYSYRSTWGDRRGWGGRRIHEGTDIFAGYHTPVRATSYGVIEIKGWNKYGGWRVGIRDMDNVYHYYAHLSGFEKGVEVGEVVEPGQVIGYVGSSGYGKPGTQGKFPPHLHYGMYRDNGLTEWSFDPYPSLRSWEKKERAAKRRR
ncbi:M23 family metallopeptidase [Bacillus alkalicellulosilyticus]|uniref:M23 family metallopeptidase n=1 Tax=Alkalihalobacterium alkalicellulosilyticum TaxID=1912214 RepID=UPI000997A231|nr:M23 family metallopeptidase [Bacillus alkalicellulosilyticus]